MRIEIEKGKNKKWFWRLISANGKTLAHSETYSSKAKALETIQILEISFQLARMRVYVEGKLQPQINVQVAK